MLPARLPKAQVSPLKGDQLRFSMKTDPAAAANEMIEKYGAMALKLAQMEVHDWLIRHKFEKALLWSRIAGRIHQKLTESDSG